MSFWSVLKKIGVEAIKVEQVAAPIISMVDPALAAPLHALDPIFAKVVTSPVTVEANNPTATDQAKSNAVIADFEAGIATTQSVLALEGKKLTYDDKSLQLAINSFVAGYNALAAVKTSFKITAV